MSSNLEITYKQLQIFQAVVVAGSITKASRRLGLSQPSISQQLAKLEEKLGSQLINRSRAGSVNLTPAGQYWFKASDEMLKRLDNIVNEHRARFVDSSVALRIGVTPTFRGRFVAAAARMAMEEPGFVKFDAQFALTSAELVERMRLHQLNCAVVNEENIADDASSFAITSLFRDEMVWVVPRAIPIGQVEAALGVGPRSGALPGALGRYVDLDGNVPARLRSGEWYRHRLPSAMPMFSASTYQTAIDMVAEGLATAHCPLSLMPNLAPSVRQQVRLFRLDGMTRNVVLVMPRHLMSLQSYARIYSRIQDFCRTEYHREMEAEEIESLPRARSERIQAVESSAPSSLLPPVSTV